MQRFAGTSHSSSKVTCEMPEASLSIGPDLIQPKAYNAALVLEDGSIFWGQGAGSPTNNIEANCGEICFNTSITGYQEVLTDPSYAGQIVVFTSPHIGNVGVNHEDKERSIASVRGCILGAEITEPANWRSAGHLADWLNENQIAALTSVDTRQITRHIRKTGFQNGCIAYSPTGPLDLVSALTAAKANLRLEGLDLAKDVSCKNSYHWNESCWSLNDGYTKQLETSRLVVAVDFGAKNNILRCLTNLGCKVIVVPANTSAKQILSYDPNGVFLSNGPGDPVATGTYAIPTIRSLIDSGVPIFGICLGHQMLCLALGAKTKKMHHGHRGANHPVKNLETGKVEITSQNHGFVVEKETLPSNIVKTHVSLFDQTLEGIRVKDKKIFSVQHHPEASPGPHDSNYLFKQFVNLMDS